MAAPSLSALVAVGARARDAASNGDAKNGTPIADDDVERYQIQPSTRPAGPAAADAPAPRPTRGGTGCLLMAPPPPRPRPPKKAVLEEEAYVDEMRRIIDRDYFPGLAEGDALPMTLDAFAARHTSEDNASFEEAQERSRLDHIRKYWWAYDERSLLEAGVEARRLLADAAAAAAPKRGDERRNGLDFAPHEARPALLFPPRYDAPRETALALARGADIRGGIQRANTRFAPPAPARPRSRSASSSESGAWPDLSDVASDSDGDSSAYPSAYDGGHDRLVPMTPRIHPGGEPGGASPLVTWGTMAATPLPLDDGGLLSQPANRREALGRSLDARAKRRQVIGDDYTTKFLLKAKVAPKAIPLSFTIENEVKDSVDGKLTAKYVEPTTGVSFDKLTLKGKTYGVEASRPCRASSSRARSTRADASPALTAELKSDKNTVIASVDKKKLAGSGTVAPFKVGVFGGGFEYPVSAGALSFSLGGSATVSGVFASCVYTPKKVFNFGMMFSPMPKLTVAATATPRRRQRRYADMKPAFGFQLTIG
ncbi:dynein light chain binding protein [Aureococcus anophagefferens]|nr:dynein light chain binding protein [Aureococcus anophagefferens]